MKPETRRVAGQIGRSHRGEAWHGPSVVETLEGVDALKAAARPVADLHTIWELVLHVIAWQKLTVQVLKGAPYVSLDGDDNFPPMSVDPTAEAWAATLAEMNSVNAELVEAVRAFPEDRLEEIVAGKPFSYYGLFHGIAEHNIYHAGQIALLKRI